ncbi:MAG: DNA topoisomerase IV subunit A [Nitrospina sp.]|jgi:DNA gyrase/topoisomerase IV subunit A|nr:DNA topoisomerase IV subunit A [Nitrospina sp.]MBT3875714.1 DNA topoisomerase IV subunit A [Nitrospina sp.]MBT4048411.1 DNA topoisomerase IV subunit A [Nitrospina sp.]MBT4557130.1 DNA topoisomerase IV subunit A [Nitrospina sp.]MBT5349825.1 DNA topoisomerase IV subunit A [Nitrospina sp.]
MGQEKTSDLQDELEKRFLTYALSTIVSRSLPDVRDGLKPIHRRILFAMDSMGMNAASKHVKSAKIIGEVLGKYHPHGDASTYESMVRMAQDFSMRYPLVDGKGNFGSLDGDSPAAYRYTEGRLTPITSFLLQDIKKDTVDFRPNYDNSLKEPVVLPSRVPNLLINGASGIAVGMACSFPSHNLQEVMSALISMIDSPKQSVANLMKYIKGPDFPTGGIILNSKTEIRKAYETGSGAVKIRGIWKVESLPRGKKQIILKEIPYAVNKARMIEKIAEIIIAKKLPPLTDVRDESDENIRVVLELKSTADENKVMSYLFKHTDLESNFQLNFTCLKPNGEPARLSLLEICQFFLDFRKQVITRRLNYELVLIEKRLHLLAGFAAIFNDLDKALKLIRSSKSRKEAHEKLQKQFKLDDEQTNAILEIPLYRLVTMEMEKILQEQKEKLKEQKRIKSILASSKKIWQEVREELEEIKGKHGDKRVTQIKTIENIEYNAEDFIEHEDVHIVLSQNGWIRKLKNLSDPSGLKFKENDQLLDSLQTNTRNLLALFTSFGIVYVSKVYNLPYTRSGFGEPIQSLFNFGDGEKVIGMLTLPAPSDNLNTSEQSDGQVIMNFAKNKKEGRDPSEFMVVSANGFGFRFPLSNLAETTRSGRKIMSLKDNDHMIGFAPVTHKYVFLATVKGKAVVIATDQITQLTGSGKGVILMKPGESHLTGFKLVDLKSKVTLIFDSGNDKVITVKSVRLCNRGSQGVIVSKRKNILKIQ